MSIRRLISAAVATAMTVALLGLGGTAAHAAAPAYDSGDRVSFSAGHLLMIGNDGRVYGSGSSGQGQLTQAGGTVTTLTPLSGLPAGVRAEAVAAGGLHSVVVGSNGVAYSAGRNNEGQLGRTGLQTTLAPMLGLPMGVAAVDAAAGQNFSLVLGDDGRVYGTGQNTQGQLTGTGSKTTLSVLSGLPAGVNAFDVVAGDAHTLVIAAAGLGGAPVLYGTGAGSLGQLGGTSDLSTLTALPGQPPVVQAAASGNRSAVVDKSGVAHTLGTGGFTAIPGAPAGHQAREVGVGPQHTVVLYQQNSAPNAYQAYGVGTVTAVREMGTLPAGTHPTLTPFTFEQTLPTREPRGLAVGPLGSVAVHDDSTVWAAGANTTNRFTGQTTSHPGRRLDGQVFGVVSQPTITLAKVNSPATFQHAITRPSTTGLVAERQWMLDGVDIPGAMTTYTPSAADHGKQLSIRVRYLTTAFEPIWLTSPAVTVAGIGQVVNTTAPTITGTARVDGPALSVNHGAWTPSATSYAYQWRRDGVPIAGATARNYQPVLADHAKQLSVEVTGRRSSYDSGTAVTAPTTVGDGQFTLGPEPTVPSEIAMNLSLAVGGTLSRWSPSGGTTRTFTWKRNGTPVHSGTGQQYAITAANGFVVGDQVTVEVTATRPGYATDSWTSPPVTVTAPSFRPNGPPVISGEPAVGQTVTVSNGSWTPTPAEYGYQWFLDGAPAPGATAASFTIPMSAAGQELWAEVTGSAPGHASATVGSLSVQVAGLGDLAATVSPSFAPAPAVGVTVTATPGSWSPAASQHAYQWLRNGAPIVGATARSYTLLPADRGARVSVRVTASSPGYTTGTAVSAARVVATGAAPTWKAKKKPKLKGKARVGKKLRAKHITAAKFAPSGVTVRYQWFRGKKKLKGATKKVYKLRKADRGKRLRVRVTVLRPGHAQGVVVSRWSVRIR